jgi:putative tricarboxylic transport membrane protein
VKLNDAVFGAILLALGSLILFTVRTFPKIPGQQVGPALFPGLIAVGLCVCGLLLLVNGWRARQQAPWFQAQAWMRSPRHLAGFAVVIGSILFYLLTAEAIGFLIVAPLVLLANLLVLKVPPKRAVLVAIVATLVIHFAFYKLLRVPLPWGVLKNHAW